MIRSISSQLTTDTPVFLQLIEGINAGEIKIPQFQRKFVWKDNQALELLDSIVNGYPIGSILLWKTTEKLNAARDLGSFRLPVTDEITPTNYVLDGQQRLTVVYSCLGADENNTGYRAGYNLEKERFVELKEGEPTTLEVFPLRKLYDTTNLLNYRASIQTLANSRTLQERLDKLVEAFTRYRLPVVTLKDLTIEEVCPIFERINSSGTRLSTYDLMVAATWSESFDLNEKITGILSTLQSKGYGGTEKSTVLKALSAINTGTIQDKSLKGLRDLRTEEMEQLTLTTQQALKAAVDALNTQFRIHSWDFLSYEAILLITAFIFRDCKELAPQQAARFADWFWRASFGERYKAGGENFVSRDLETIKNYVLNQAGGHALGSIPTPNEWGQTHFRSNVSKSRAFILALANASPLNLSNGMKIDVEFALSGYNKKEYHHVYPRAYLRRIGMDAFSNVLGNIIILTSNTNKLISDENPAIYIPRLVETLGDQADNIFRSNLLPLPSEFDYTTNNYRDFLAARGKILTSFVDSLTIHEPF
jgi:hypothetical protein